MQLDLQVNWNWGLVFLPIWIYFFLQCILGYYYRKWGIKIITDLGDIDRLTPEEIQSNPKYVMKFHQAQSLFSLSSATYMKQIPLLLTALLLVCRLEVSSYSTFIILIVVFIGLGCCCCITFCGLFIASTIDIEELEREQLRQQQAAASMTPSDTAVDKEATSGYVLNPNGGVDTLNPPSSNSTSNTTMNVIYENYNNTAATTNGNGTTTSDANVAYGTFNDTTTNLTPIATATTNELLAPDTTTNVTNDINFGVNREALADID